MKGLDLVAWAAKWGGMPAANPKALKALIDAGYLAPDPRRPGWLLATPDGLQAAMIHRILQGGLGTEGDDDASV